jgi:hypothetical protein
MKSNFYISSNFYLKLSPCSLLQTLDNQINIKEKNEHEKQTIRTNVNYIDISILSLFTANGGGISALK